MGSSQNNGGKYYTRSVWTFDLRSIRIYICSSLSLLICMPDIIESLELNVRWKIKK